jgi:hypothetical protein
VVSVATWFVWMFAILAVGTVLGLGFEPIAIVFAAVSWLLYLWVQPRL